MLNRRNRETLSVVYFKNSNQIYCHNVSMLYKENLVQMPSASLNGSKREQKKKKECPTCVARGRASRPVCILIRSDGRLKPWEVNDERTPHEFIAEFETQVYDVALDDGHKGRLFLPFISCGSGLGWADHVDYDQTKFSILKKRFLADVWMPQLKCEILRKFLNTNRYNCGYENFLDYFLFWDSKLRHITLDQGIALHIFTNTLPKPMRYGVKRNIKTMDDFRKYIDKFKRIVFEWSLYKDEEFLNKR